MIESRRINMENTDSMKAQTHYRGVILSQSAIDFNVREKYEAGENLRLTRSECYNIRKTEPVLDIWQKKPPDFRPQNYKPSPPKRNTRDSMQPWKYGTFPGATKPSPTVSYELKLPRLLQPARPKSGKLINTFNIMDSDGAQHLFVKEGMYPTGLYKMPTKHDFRGYPPISSLGLSEFRTDSDKDPYNIKFKTANKDIIYGLVTKPTSDRYMGRQIGREPLLQGPKWDQQLILPTLKWPTRTAEFSRFRRRNRSPTTALMDRIEETLNNRWSEERQERKRLKKEKQKIENKKRFQEEIANEMSAMR